MKDVQQSIEKGFSDLTRFAHIFFALFTLRSIMGFFMVVLPFNPVSLDFV